MEESELSENIFAEFTTDAYLDSNNSSNNETTPQLPIDMTFNSGHLMSIYVYSFLFVFSTIGNLTVLIVLIRRRQSRFAFPSMDFLLLHLAVADLIVTFLMMPLEVAWAITVRWLWGDLLCRVMSFFRIFGLFLSSFVLVCLAVDRYIAVKHPIKALAGVKRSHKMIAFSWVLSIICSAPQLFFFKVENHPVFKWYSQCGVFSSLPTKMYKFAYFLFGMIFMYVGPLVIIAVLYSGIVTEIFRKHRESKRQLSSINGGEGLRRSGIGNFGKAKQKALKMTVTVFAIYLICWTPYYFISLWYFIDEASFKQLDPRLNKAMFFFACTNSTMNPLVYGIFHLRNNNIQRNRSGTLRQGESIQQFREGNKNQNLTIVMRKKTTNVKILPKLEESPSCSRSVTPNTTYV